MRLRGQDGFPRFSAFVTGVVCLLRSPAIRRVPFLRALHVSFTASRSVDLKPARAFPVDIRRRNLSVALLAASFVIDPAAHVREHLVAELTSFVLRAVASALGLMRVSGFSVLHCVPAFPASVLVVHIVALRASFLVRGAPTRAVEEAPTPSAFLRAFPCEC